MPSSEKRVAVIGAGIAGVTTAYKLAKSGFPVTLFEKHPYPAMETSFANGGQLSASNAEVWNSTVTILKGIKWMFSPGAPLLVNPRPTWHKLSWMAEFVAAIPRYEQNTIATARMAIAARTHLKQMATDEGIDFDCETRGILHFYKSREEFEAAQAVTRLLSRAGLERRAVGPEEIRKIEPALQGDIYAGFYTESDLTGDIHKFTVGLTDACKRIGVNLRFRCHVSTLKAQRHGVSIAYRPDTAGESAKRSSATEDFDAVVICAGVRSREFARQLGDRVNVYPVKGYSITVNLIEEADVSAAPWVSLLDDNAKIVTSRLGRNRFRVAGTAEFNGFNRDIRAERIDPLIAWCRQHFPEMGTRQSVPWAGLRPMMPNMMPRVGRGASDHVFYNTGHGHLGWTLSAATAEITAALVSEARCSHAPA